LDGSPHWKTEGWELLLSAPEEERNRGGLVLQPSGGEGRRFCMEEGGDPELPERGTSIYTGTSASSTLYRRLRKKRGEGLLRWISLDVGVLGKDAYGEKGSFFCGGNVLPSFSEDDPIRKHFLQTRKWFFPSRKGIAGASHANGGGIALLEVLLGIGKPTTTYYY